MLDISEELKTIYKTDVIPLSEECVPKDLELYFPELDLLIGTDKIVDDSFSLEEKLCSSDNLVFGSCEAAICKIKLADVSVDIKGHEFILTQTIDSEHRVPLGIFIVDSVEIEEGLRFKSVVAFDKMINTDIDVSEWYNSLELPLTLKEFRESLLEHLEVEYEEEFLVNDDIVVERTIDPATISGRDILKACAELNGAFGHINRQGKFVYVTLEKDITIDAIPSAICRKIKKEEYVTEPISRLQIRQEDGDIGAIVGEGSNAYIIEGNFLVFGKTAAELEEIANNVYMVIEGITYTPFKSVSLGLPYLELGDRIEFEEAFTSYIAKRTFTGTQALKDEFEASGARELEQSFGLNNEIIQLKGRYAKIKKDVDGIYTEVGNLEENVSTSIEQLADQLVLKLDDNGNIGLFKLGKNEDGTEILIKADNIVLEGLVTANGYFKILEDGSVETSNITATSGTIAGFNFDDDETKHLTGFYYINPDNGKYMRISPINFRDGDGEVSTRYGSIDLGYCTSMEDYSALIHLRSDGYARFGKVSDIGSSLRFNDFLRWEETSYEKGSDTIVYSQNFRINTDGTVRIKSPDIPKPAKSIDITSNKLTVDFVGGGGTSYDLKRDASGLITKMTSDDGVVIKLSCNL